MTKRPRTEKQLANDARLREQAQLRREVQNNVEVKETPVSEVPPIAPLPVQETIQSDDDLDALKKQIEELKQMVYWQAQANNPQKVNTHVNQQGSLVGTTEKFTVDPTYYADPIERLKEEPKLTRFAFKENYEVKYEVGVSEYQTKDGVNMREPKFMMELHGIVFDEDTGEPTNQRYIISRLIAHEDPQTAIVIARQNGIQVDESNERQFLDDMRYLRFRDWLLEAFYPAKADAGSLRDERAVNGVIREFFTVSTDNGAEAPKLKFPKFKF